MDPFTEQSEQLQQFSIDMTRGGVFENGQEGIIAIDIQEMDFPSLTITSTNESQWLRVMDCLKKIL
jgi:deoxycytidine triphosphate deaminase